MQTSKINPENSKNKFLDLAPKETQISKVVGSLLGRRQVEQYEFELVGWPELVRRNM